MARNRLIALLAASVLIVWGMSCQSPSSSGNPAAAAGIAGGSTSANPPTVPTTGQPGVGTLELSITDGPVDDVDRILVKMTEIRVHRYGDDESSGFVSIWSNPAGLEFDVLRLKTDPLSFAPATLAAGTYNQIRIALVDEPGKIYLKADPTKDYPLSVPSDEIKIHLQFEVPSGGMTQVLLDFDAEQSLHVVQKGKKSQEYLLRPVINPVSQRTTAGS